MLIDQTTMRRNNSRRMADVPDKPEEIGRRIYTLRVAMGHKANQGGFAKLCGISAPALANYEAGERRPDLDQLSKIVTRTGATYEWLLHGRAENLPVRLSVAIRDAEADLNGEPQPTPRKRRA